MAIIYTKGKKDLGYTGINKVMHDFGSVVETIKSTARGAVKSVGDTIDRRDKAMAAKELDDISRGFGSVENYEKHYPQTKKRNNELRTRAGY